MTTTKKTFTTAISIVMAVVMMVLGFTTVSMKASASWYGWTHATFSAKLVGQERYYDGNSVGINWGESTHNSAPTHFNNSNGFNITLQKKGAFGTWTSLATKNFPRSGGGTAKWESVGSGTYRFVFSKGTDGVTVYMEDVEMYSW